MKLKRLITSLITGCTFAASVASPFCSTYNYLTISNIIKAEASEETENSIIYGDVNNDKLVDMYDLTLIQREANVPGSTSINLIVADVNADGKVDYNDVIEVKDFIIRKRKVFSVNQVKVPTYDGLGLIADITSEDFDLQPDQHYYSQDKKYYVTFQKYDGNLVIYKNEHDNITYDQPVWYSGTANKNAKTCRFQKDRNFVIYDNSGKALWDSKTNSEKNNENNMLYLSNEGKLCIYSVDTGVLFSSNKNADNFIVSNYYSTFYEPIANSLDEDFTFDSKKHYYSPERKYYVVFREDGNLAVYKNEYDTIDKDLLVWETGTAKTNVAHSCKLKTDGNLVINGYNNEKMWDSNTDGNGNSILYLSDEGELCIYAVDKGIYTFSSQAIAISTLNDVCLEREKKYYSPNGEYYAVFQEDGNLVVYYKNGKAKWHSQTYHKGVQSCILEANGNLVIYGDNKEKLWNSESEGMGNARLFVSNAGKLCIYSEDAKRYTYIDKSEISIEDNDIQIIRRNYDPSDPDKYKISCSESINKEDNNRFTTDFTNLSNNPDDSLMLRRVDVSTTVRVKNMSEADIRDHLIFFVQFKVKNKTSGERNVKNKDDSTSDDHYYVIEKTIEPDTYKLTAKNVPCFGDKVKFGLKVVDADPQNIEYVSQFEFTNTDNDFKTYDVNCTYGENLHITLDYDCNEEKIEIWLKMLSRFINSLSDITGVKRKDIYIFVSSDSLCNCPNMNESIIPSDDGTIIPAVLIPYANWVSAYKHTESSINDINGENPVSLHLEYLHEVSHCYANFDAFRETFNGNADDGNTLIRGITALQNCTQLKECCVYCEVNNDNFEFDTNNRGTYNKAVRNVTDARFEDNNYKLLNLYAHYVDKYGENGWAIIEKYFEGGDPAFDTNLFSNVVQNAIKNELKNTPDVDKTKCDDLCVESIKFINTLQFLQQNAPEYTYNNSIDGMSRFISDFVTKNPNPNNYDRDYSKVFIEYFEKLERNNRHVSEYMIDTYGVC